VRWSADGNLLAISQYQATPYSQVYSFNKTTAAATLIATLPNTTTRTTDNFSDLNFSNIE
jgi:hypothetical protein